MSSIPLLGGLAAFAAATSLTLTAALDLQMQQRNLASSADAVAIELSETAALDPALHDTSVATSSATQLARYLVDRPYELTRVDAWFLDSATLDVVICRKAKVLLLPWLNLTGVQPVCASAKARPV